MEIAQIDANQTVETVVTTENALIIAPENTVAPELPETELQKQVRISLTQENKSGKVTSSFVWNAQGETLSEFVADTCNRIVKVMEIQNRIATKGGKNRAFGFTKGGKFQLDILVQAETENNKMLNNFVFDLPSLGSENPADVLCDMVEGYNLLVA